jgi:hypothetical protein
MSNQIPVLTPKKIEKELQAFIAKDDLRPPMMHIHNDGEYIVASDGHLLAVIDISLYPHLADVGKKVEGYPNYKPFLNPHQDLYDPITTESFILPDDKFEMEDIYDKVETNCKQCKGSGEVDHDCFCQHCTTKYEECSECKGEGKIITSSTKPIGKAKVPGQYVMINESCFNANYINQAFKFFKNIGKTKVKIKTNLELANKAMTIEAAGIMVTVMPLLQSPTVKENIIHTHTVPLKPNP